MCITVSWYKTNVQLRTYNYFYKNIKLLIDYKKNITNGIG